MDIQPDLSVCFLPASGDRDLTSSVETVLAQGDPVLLELLLPTGVGLEEQFGSRSEVRFVEYPHTEPGKNVYHVWQQAKGRYLATLPSSVLPGAGSFLAMLEFLDDHPDIGGAAPRLFSPEGVLLENCFQFALIPWGAPRKMSGWDGCAVMEIDWMSPAAFFVNRLAFADCLAKDFAGGNWPRQVCKRLRAKGWHQFFVYYSKVIAVSPMSSYL